MKARGYVSETAHSGVDVSALAKAVGISYEMARRYAEGSALPRPEKLAAIATWLGVPPAQLAWGDTSTGGQSIDAGVLQQCIQAITAAQQRTRKPVTTEKTAQLVAILYEEAMMGRFPTDQSIDLMLRAS